MISATAKDGTGKTARVRINVVNTKAELTVPSSEGWLYVGERIKLSPVLHVTKNGTDSYSTDSILGDNSNSIVAALSEDFIITGLTPGFTTVTFFSDRYQVNKQTVKLEVVERPIEVIVANREITENDGCTDIPDDIDGYAGEHIQLYAYAKDMAFSPDGACTIAFAEDQNFVWSSSNEDAAKVDQNGLVTLVDDGTSVITAVNPASGKSAEIVITASEIYFSIDSVIIETGSNYNVAFYVNAGAREEPLKWESSNESIAVVNETGLIHALSEGETTVKVSMTEHPGAEAELKVVVNAKPTPTLTPMSVPTEIPSIVPTDKNEADKKNMPDIPENILNQIPSYILDDLLAQSGLESDDANHTAVPDSIYYMIPAEILFELMNSAY